jgi:nucleoside-diphosphate-sugar epimerase
MRVAIIGATGHIGTWLVPRLVRGGHNVIAVSRGASDPYHGAIEWESVRHVELDRSAAERDGSFGSRIAALDADVIVDLICFDIASARHIVEAVRNQVKLFVHCGTLWVHGAPKSRPYDETAAREPIGDYGARKAEIEKFLLNEARSGFPATILHAGHITGPGWAPINPAGNLDLHVFEKLAGGEKVALPGDGLATLQHVHADDVAQAFELAITHPARAIGEAFHVAADQPITMRDYAIGASEWFGREPDLEFLPWESWISTVSKRDAEITSDHVVHSPHASIGKARMRLGFEPRFTALAAAADAVAWLSEEGRLKL